MKIEIRNDHVIIDGYVNAVCRDSKPLMSHKGLFVEQIKEGVFKRALERANNILLLFNHDNKRKLGSVNDGNIELYEDNIGLRVHCTTSDPEIIKKAKNNELRGWSFGFICNSQKWEDAEPYNRRFVEDMELLEVSILDKTPAYNGTSVEVRADKQILTENRGYEFDKVIDNTTHEEQEERNYSEHGIEWLENMMNA